MTWKANGGMKICCAVVRERKKEEEKNSLVGFGQQYNYLRMLFAITVSPIQKRSLLTAEEKILES